MSGGITMERKSIYPNYGYLFTDGKGYYSVLYLSCNDSIENYAEVSIEYVLNSKKKENEQ